MKIKVVSRDGHRVKLRFPTAVLGWYPARKWLCSMMRDKGVNITPKQVKTMVKALRQYKRSHRDWKLLEAESSGGDRIEIRI